MKRNDIIGEHKKGVRAIKYNKKPTTHSEPPKPRNPVAKNATAAVGGGAAGAHKDAKKSSQSVRGQKHKAPPEMAEGYNPNSAGAEHRRKLDQSHAAHLKAKATGPDASTSDKQRYQNYLDKKERMANDYNDRMEREDIEQEALYRSLGSSSAYDRDKRSSETGFGRPRDHRGLDQELAHETNNYAVAIDGRTWKVFASKNHAQAVARSLQNKGKNASVHETGAEPTAEGIGEEAPIAGKVSQVTAKDVTIDDPTQGIKITAPINRLVKDATGKLTLAKPAASAAVGATGTQGQQQDKIQAGQPVSIMPDATQESVFDEEVIDLGNGAQKRTNPDGTYEIGDGSGLKLYSADGKLIKTISPNFAGFSQETDMATGNVTKRYSSGPMSTSQTTDKTGKPITTKANYDLGIAKVDTELDHRSGIRSNAIDTPGMDPNELLPTAGIAAAKGVDPKKFAAFQKQNPSAVKSPALEAMLRIAGLR